jgi:predicted secreted hydrolase
LVSKAFAALACGLICLTAVAQGSYAPVLPGRLLRFPADTGSHPAFRTEWWYVTGWLSTADGRPLGFQITFFRTKPDIDTGNPSAFTPRQLMIAHCALSDPQRGRLWQDQRIRRAGLGLAGADEGNTHAWIEGWSLQRQGGKYIAKIAAEDFGFDLTLSDTQMPLINGADGFSRKGPGETAASYYYSLPHLQVAGTLTRQGTADKVTGEAWFDHEWSSEYLDAQAAGWDWIGIDLDGGGALMAFQIRALDGTRRWAGGSLRAADGAMQLLRPEDVEFHPLRSWTSTRSGVSYPVEWTVRAGSRQFRLSPLFDDQENDTRLSTGAIYWEGAVRAFEHDAEIGRGYLELTGYGERLRLR